MHVLQAKFPAPEKIHLSSHAALFIDHDNVIIEDLSLDGALVVEGANESTIIVDGLSVIHPHGWEWCALKDGNNAAEHEKIRYRLSTCLLTKQLSLFVKHDFCVSASLVLTLSTLLAEAL